MLTFSVTYSCPETPFTKASSQHAWYHVTVIFQSLLFSLFFQSQRQIRLYTPPSHCDVTRMTQPWWCNGSFLWSQLEPGASLSSGRSNSISQEDFSWLRLNIPFHRTRPCTSHNTHSVHSCTYHNPHSIHSGTPKNPLYTLMHTTTPTLYTHVHHNPHSIHSCTPHNPTLYTRIHLTIPILYTYVHYTTFILQICVQLTIPMYTVCKPYNPTLYTCPHLRTLLYILTYTSQPQYIPYNPTLLIYSKYTSLYILMYF